MGFCARSCGLILAIILSCRFFLPYPSFIAQPVAKVFDFIDANPELFLKSELSVISEALRDVFPVVGAGGHYDNYLAGKVTGNYFEGWYYKLLSGDGKTSIVTIPCVIFDKENKNNRGFIISGIISFGGEKNEIILSKEADLSNFDLKEISGYNFGGKADKFIYKIGNSTFGADFVDVNIPGVLQGRVDLKKVLSYPATFFTPTIMGWFQYIDKFFGMECVHRVLAVDSVLEGTLTWLKGTKKEVKMTGGLGYVEGDYGTSFPKRYAWVQSNDFPKSKGSSMLLSVAKVPLPDGKSSLVEVEGFFGYVYDAKIKKFYTFGTYTGAVITVFDNFFGVSHEEFFKRESVGVEVRDLQYIYYITCKATRSLALPLWAPREINGLFEMRRYLDEMLDAEIYVKITRRSDDKVVFESTAINGGLELG